MVEVLELLVETSLKTVLIQATQLQDARVSSKHPTFKTGYSPFGCCICRPRVPNCSALGFNGGIDLTCAKKIIIGAPKQGSCKAGEEKMVFCATSHVPPATKESALFVGDDLPRAGSNNLLVFVDLHAAAYLSAISRASMPIKSMKLMSRQSFSYQKY